MSNVSNPEAKLKPADLRGILHYVHLFRGHTFVISLDGSVLEGENLSDLLTDIAVLHSLQIRIVLVHGTGNQLRKIAEQRDIPLTDVYGLGPTDEATLHLSIEASSQATHLLQSRLTQVGLRFELSNALRATERGVVKGIDYALTGRVEKVDIDYIQKRIDEGIIPLFSPIAYNRDGKAMRLNSDATAVDLAIGLEASKLLFLSPFSGLEFEGAIRKSLPVPELESYLSQSGTALHPSLQSKAKAALYALRHGVSRVHILDGNAYGSLLNEIFEKEGVGTMVHADDYQQIRPAQSSDVQAIYSLTRQGVESDALRQRSWKSIHTDLEKFYVYEIDDFIIACASLTIFEDAGAAELGTVYVHPVYQGRGVGRKMVAYAEKLAVDAGAHQLFALSTQNFSFFQKSGGFLPADPGELPGARRQDYEKEARGGQILKKRL